MNIADLKKIIDSFDDELEVVKVDIITKDGYGGRVIYNFDDNDNKIVGYDIDRVRLEREYGKE